VVVTLGTSEVVARTGSVVVDGTVVAVGVGGSMVDGTIAADVVGETSAVVDGTVSETVVTGTVVGTTTTSGSLPNTPETRAITMPASTTEPATNTRVRV
jgi:hypothetical protein